MGKQRNPNPAVVLKELPADGSLHWFVQNSGRRHELWRQRRDRTQQLRTGGLATYLIPAHVVAVVSHEDGGHNWRVVISGRQPERADFTTLYEAKAWVTAMIGLGEAG